MSEFNADEHKGFCEALGMVQGSLRGYPNHGGDIEIMQEVERIVREATTALRELAADYHHDCPCTGSLNRIPCDFCERADLLLKGAKQ